MVNGIGHLHKLGKNNRQQSVVTNILLNTTLPNLNSHDKYNEKVDVESKKPITTEPITDQVMMKMMHYTSFCIFILCLVVD